MASLDKLEGEAIEAVGLVLFVVIALVIYGVWKGNPAQAISQLLKKLWNAIDSMFSFTVDKLTSTGGDTFGSGTDAVYTGSNLSNPNDFGGQTLAQYAASQDGN